MRWIKLTRTNSGRYNGPMLIDADKLLGMQRDPRGTYTSLLTTVPNTAADEYGNAPGGFEGLDVRETPEDIMAMLEGRTVPEQPHCAAPVRS